MKHYRIAYDRLFLPNNINDGFVYKNEQILDISIDFIFIIVNKESRKEYLFQSNEDQDQKIQYTKNKWCYVDEFYRCSVDPVNGYKLELNQEMDNESIFNVSYEIGICCKNINDTPVVISYKEFIDILKNNYEQFNNSNNKPTQCLAYRVVEI